MIAVILAGGRGSRLGEETETKPKPLVDIGGRPIIWHIMNIYSHHGINDFIVCLGYKGYRLKEYFANLALHDADVTIEVDTSTTRHHRAPILPWRITLVETGVQTMTGGRLRRVASHLAPGETFCLTYGDGLADVDITASIEFHRRHGRLATVTAVAPAARFGRLEIDGGGMVTSFDEKPYDTPTANGGFFVLEPGVLDYIDGDATAWEHEPLRRLARDGQLAAHAHNGFWQPMDTMWERDLLERLWVSGSAPWKVWGPPGG